MKAIAFNLLAWVMLPIMDGFAKYLSTDMPVLQITWARYFFTVAFTLPVMFFFFKKYLVWTDKPKLQFLRGLILLCANICFFYAISVISLAKALTLAFVAPLIVTAFSPIFLKEKVGYKRWLAVIIGFIGSDTNAWRATDSIGNLKPANSDKTLEWPAATKQTFFAFICPLAVSTPTIFSLFFFTPTTSHCSIISIP